MRNNSKTNQNNDIQLITRFGAECNHLDNLGNPYSKINSVCPMCRVLLDSVDNYTTATYVEFTRSENVLIDSIPNIHEEYRIKRPNQNISVSNVIMEENIENLSLLMSILRTGHGFDIYGLKNVRSSEVTIYPRVKVTPLTEIDIYSDVKEIVLSDMSINTILATMSKMNVIRLIVIGPVDVTFRALVTLG